MSTTKKSTITVPVETVENFARCINYITSTMDFWHVNKSWPGNLMYDCLDELSKQIGQILDIEIIKNVSRSHINDK